MAGTDKRRNVSGPIDAETRARAAASPLALLGYGAIYPPDAGATASDKIVPGGWERFFPL